MQNDELFHLQYSDLQSNSYSLSGCEKRANSKPNSQVFDRNSMNIGRIAYLKAGGEWACKTAQSMYWSRHNMIRTQILNWSQSCEVRMLGFWWKNWPNCKGPDFLGVITVATVQFRSQPLPGTVLAGWDRCQPYLRPWQNECQRSVNNFRSWKSGNQNLIW